MLPPPLSGFFGLSVSFSGVFFINSSLKKCGSC